MDLQGFQIPGLMNYCVFFLIFGFIPAFHMGIKHQEFDEAPNKVVFSSFLFGVAIGLYYIAKDGFPELPPLNFINATVVIIAYIFGLTCCITFGFMIYAVICMIGDIISAAVEDLFSIYHE